MNFSNNIEYSLAGTSNRLIRVVTAMLALVPLIIVLGFRTVLSDELVQSALLPAMVVGVFVYEAVDCALHEKELTWFFWLALVTYLCLVVRIVVLWF